MHERFLKHKLDNLTYFSKSYFDSIYNKVNEMLIEKSANNLIETQSILQSIDFIKELDLFWLLFLEIDVDLNDTNPTYKNGWDLTYKLCFNTYYLNPNFDSDYFFSIEIKHHPHIIQLFQTNNKLFNNYLLYLKSLNDLNKLFIKPLYLTLIIIKNLSSKTLLKNNNILSKDDIKKISLNTKYSDINITVNIKCLKELENKLIVYLDNLFK